MVVSDPITESEADELGKNIEQYLVDMGVDIRTACRHTAHGAAPREVKVCSFCYM
jgi:hypothetical protein